MVIYIAGPYTAPNSWEREQNIRTAEAACFALWRAGIAAICVHAMSRYFYGGVSEENAIAIDDELLMLCDGILLVGNWRDSAGSLREKEIAELYRLDIYSSVEDIIAQRDAALAEMDE